MHANLQRAAIEATSLDKLKVSWLIALIARETKNEDSRNSDNI